MPRRDVTDELRRDVLVDIPKGQERRFGTDGGPFPNPPPQAGKGRQSEALSGGGRRLARQHRADTTCPFVTKRALMTIAEDAAATAPWWRIVKPDGAMMAYFPGGAATTGAATQGRGIDAK